MCWVEMAGAVATADFVGIYAYTTSYFAQLVGRTKTGTSSRCATAAIAVVTRISKTVSWALQLWSQQTQKST